jgi:hypothetical protein
MTFLDKILRRHSKKEMRNLKATTFPVEMSQDAEEGFAQRGMEFDKERMKTASQQRRKERIAKAENDPNLHCYGCAHSAASEPFPGKPSGERPCCFCVRNPDRLAWLQRALEMESMSSITQLPERSPFKGVWYDGSPAIHNPMDCYSTIDMQDQQLLWQGEDPDTMIRFG